MTGSLLKKLKIEFLLNNIRVFEFQDNVCQTVTLLKMLNFLCELIITFKATISLTRTDRS